MKKIRVAVALSGGIDSASAAYLLKKKGYDVFGVYLRMYDDPQHDFTQRKKDLDSICRKLGIELYVIDARQKFSAEIIEPFCREYVEGRTPNPCIECNSRLKFSFLFEKAKDMGADRIATGHYARVDYDRVMGRYLLKKGIDREKDQSYFLYRVDGSILNRTLMPLGELYKFQVRRISLQFCKELNQKQESQEICFIPGNDYRAYIMSRTDSIFPPGDITDKNQKVLGRHRGIINYTVGQRKGLGIAAKRPLYVTGIDRENNRIIAGEREDAFAKTLIIEDTCWHVPQPEKTIRVKARIRYRHIPEYAWVSPLSKGLYKISFENPQFAVTPGQSAVFYRYNKVLGGGIINKVFKEDRA